MIYRGAAVGFTLKFIYRAFVIRSEDTRINVNVSHSAVLARVG